MEAERFPSPPFPAPDSPVLGMIIEGALAAYESGEADVRVAVTHAAVHAWYEGHIPGRGRLPRMQLPRRLTQAVLERRGQPRRLRQPTLEPEGASAAQPHATAGRSPGGLRVQLPSFTSNGAPVRTSGYVP